MNLEELDIETVAKAVEADAGQPLPGLRESLAQAQRGEYAVVHTPEQIMARQRARGRPLGSVQSTTKQAVKLRLDADVLEAIKATGSGWQTRINDMLRASLKLAGRV